jgi:hypothetical protein
MLAAWITCGCSTTHYVALSDELLERLARCERPAEIPARWAVCATESCRRAQELPIHTENAKRHHRCADVLDDVKAEAENAKNQ